MKFDVAVCGGGPAGAAAAIALARRGARVALIERAPASEWRAGETLAPEARPLLDALGVWARFAAAKFLPSYAVASAWGGPELRERRLVMQPWSVGWHLDRARFDALLVAAAAEAGAKIFRGAAVEHAERINAAPQNFAATPAPQNFVANAPSQNFAANAGTEHFAATAETENFAASAATENFAGDTTNAALQNFATSAGTEHFAATAETENFAATAATENFAGDATRAGAGGGVRVALVGGEVIEASVVIDASGAAARIARAFGAQRARHDRLVALVVHLAPAPASAPDGDARPLEQILLLESVERGWWYSAPVGDGALLAAFLSDGDLLPNQDDFAQELARAPHTAARAKNFRVATARACPAPTAIQDETAGEGWLAVGDAAWSADPLSGSGLSRALASGLAAAAALAEHFSRTGNFAVDAALAAAWNAGRRREFARFQKSRALHYADERRWPDAPFWRRRQQTPAARVP